MGDTSKLTPREALIGELLLGKISDHDSPLFRSAIGDQMDERLVGNPAEIIPEWIGNGWDAFRSRCLLWQLRLLGVEKVEVEYGGGGDNGSTESIIFTPDIDALNTPAVSPFDGKLARNSSEGSGNVESVLDGIAWDLITKAAGWGWYNEDGGQGNVLFDVVQGIATVSHVNYYCDAESATLEKFELTGDLLTAVTDFVSRFPQTPGLKVSLSFFGDPDPSVELESSDIGSIPSDSLHPFVNMLAQAAQTIFSKHPAFGEAPDEESFNCLEITLLSENTVKITADWPETQEDDLGSISYSLETFEEADSEDVDISGTDQ